MVLDGLKLEFVGYPNHTGGKVWIGLVSVAEVYQRESGGDLFEPLVIKYEFQIHPWLKYQPEDNWLEMLPLEERGSMVDTIEEGLEWVKTKLYGE